MTSAKWIAAQVETLNAASRAAANADGPALIAIGVTYTQTQADLARLSGLTPNTLKALKDGKRPNAGQRSAILWGIARRLGLV